MMVEKIKTSSVTIPVWMVTLVFSIIFALVGYGVSSINARLDRIENKLDTHIMND